MTNESKEILYRLAKLSAEEIGNNENNVKYKFIMPLLKAFGYKEEIDFEHSAQGNRIDILIRTTSHNKLLVEAKSYDKSLDEYVLQLKRYCDEISPLVAMLTNGKEIRLYSPFWRGREFHDRLIYVVQRNDIADEHILEKLEKVLSRHFLENREIIDEHIGQREKELEAIYKTIKEKNTFYEQEIDGLKHHVIDIGNQIVELQNKLDETKSNAVKLEKEKADNIEELKKSNLIFCPKNTTTGFQPMFPPPLKPDINTQHRKTGTKKYKCLEDYVIPVVQLMQKGDSHQEAFRKIAKKLDDGFYSSVFSECTRGLKISLDEFKELVISGRIKLFLKNNFPDKTKLIEQELEQENSIA